jgi:hypothetical protein
MKQVRREGDDITVDIAADRMSHETIGKVISGVILSEGMYKIGYMYI